MYIFVRMLLWVLAAWRWGDWRNWKEYQSTFLFVILLDLLYNFLTYNYPLWVYDPTDIIPNHTLNNLLVSFISYPAVVFIYLGRYPTGWVKQVAWIIFWVTLFSIVELVNYKMDLMSYHNGWNFGWSVLFYLVQLPFIQLHYKKPLLAYGLSVLIIVGLLLLFKVPVSKMK
ncbi:hypothetical protein M3226_30135 [Neobacillus cucumis]|uniref:CBO0543 family protein n=1 Tax=Neobacillus cucumis TaxID=1740721 RepID=UPI00203F2444|nr:CBO0543 family protein [Neobacillus cucumis]MCM3729793.1 hypothetical protein [Neobacillus cucumis]